MIKERILEILKTDTLKDVSIMTMATGISAILAAFYFILVARLTDPVKLGIFSLATAASFMFSDIFDIAINASLVRFVSRELTRDERKANQYLKFIFLLKIIIAGFLMLLLSLLAGPLSKLLFGEYFTNILILVGMGTGFQLIYSFTVSHLQAKKLFFRAAQAIILLPAIRLIGLFLLILVERVTISSLLYIYFFSTLIGIVPIMLIASRRFFYEKNEFRVAKRFFKYNLPLTAGFSVSAVGGRVDNFILANLVGSLAVGFYAAAFRLFSPIQFLLGSLSTVFAPRFSSFQSSEQAREYLKKTILLAIFIAFLLLAAYPFSPYVITLLFGHEFISSIPVFKLLIFGFAVFALQTPFVSTIMYFLAKPKVFALLSFVQLFLISTLNVILVQRYAQIGAAFAFLITQVVMLLLAISYVLFSLKKPLKIQEVTND